MRFNYFPARGTKTTCSYIQSLLYSFIWLLYHPKKIVFFNLAYARYLQILTKNKYRITSFLSFNAECVQMRWSLLIPTHIILLDYFITILASIESLILVYWQILYFWDWLCICNVDPLQDCMFINAIIVILHCNYTASLSLFLISKLII
jgi:hypothetical protein